jgi:hypothetical protein
MASHFRLVFFLDLRLWRIFSFSNSSSRPLVRCFLLRYFWISTYRRPDRPDFAAALTLPLVRLFPGRPGSLQESPTSVPRQREQPAIEQRCYAMNRSGAARRHDHFFDVLPFRLSFGHAHQVRLQLGVGRRIGFAPVRLVAKAAPAGVVDRGTIEIEFATARGCGSPARWMQRRRRRRLRCWRKVGGDDPGRFGGTGVDCDRHAPRDEHAGAVVQEALKRDPRGGDLYVFRGKSGKLIKILWHDARHVALRQAAGAWPLHLAIGVGRRRGDHAGAARLFARRYRLAPSASQLATIGGGLRCGVLTHGAE